MAFNVSWTAFDYPNITSGFFNALEYGNSVTDGLLSLSLVFSLFVILFMAFRRAGDKEAFVASSFISGVISLMLLGTGQLIEVVTFGLLSMAVFGAILLTRTRR